MTKSEEAQIYLKGEFVPQSQAKVSVYDRCYLYGDGLFESIPVWNGRPFRTDWHLDRLWRGMGFFRMASPLTRDGLKKAIAKTIEINGLTHGYLRVQLSRGEGEGADMWNQLKADPYFMIYGNPIPKQKWTDSPAKKSGLTGTVVATRRTPSLCKASETKDCNFLNNIQASIERVAAGADIGILLDIDGNVAEGISYNVFIVNDGVVRTPTLKACLPGITRKVLIEIGDNRGERIVETDFSVYELCTADEVFVASSIFLCIPVIEIDGRKIGDGKGGPIAEKLGHLLLEEMEKESH